MHQRYAARKDAIREHRLSQPLAELERKAKKSARRGLWTQEQIDWAQGWARDFVQKANIT